MPAFSTMHIPCHPLPTPKCLFLLTCVYIQWCQFRAHLGSFGHIVPILGTAAHHTHLARILHGALGPTLCRPGPDARRIERGLAIRESRLVTFGSPTKMTTRDDSTWGRDSLIYERRVAIRDSGVLIRDDRSTIIDQWKRDWGCRMADWGFWMANRLADSSLERRYTS